MPLSSLCQNLATLTISFFFSLHFAREVGLKLPFVMGTGVHRDVLNYPASFFGISGHLIFLEHMHCGGLAMIKPFLLEIVPRFCSSGLILQFNEALVCNAWMNNPTKLPFPL